MSLLKKLNEPFPVTDTLWENIRYLLFAGLFVTFFLYTFQPNFDGYPHNKFFLCCRFGIITIVVGFLYEVLLTYVLKINRTDASWTLLKWIISMLVLIIFITIGNYSFIKYLNQDITWHLTGFLNMLYMTFVIGLFPTLLSGLLIQMRAIKNNESHAKDLNTHIVPTQNNNTFLRLASSNEKQIIELPNQEILYFESMQNYVAVYFYQNQQIEKELIRNTLKNIELQVQNSNLLRCHRSFMVNPNQVEKVEGNAQGLKLKLRHLDDVQIPVSRKYIPEIRAFFAKVNG